MKLTTTDRNRIIEELDLVAQSYASSNDPFNTAELCNLIQKLKDPPSTWVLCEVMDEGLSYIMTTEAHNLIQAIHNLNLYPFTYPDDWYDWDDKSREESLDTTYWEALERVTKFYLGPNHYAEGNYVDGDSNCAYFFIEITPDGTVKQWGPRTYPATNEQPKVVTQ